MKKYASLRWRLAALIAGGSAVSAVIAAAGFSWLDLHRFWDHTGAEVAAIGNIVADQVGPAITLSDQKAANELLGSLRADNLVRDAVDYDAPPNDGAIAAESRLPPAIRENRCEGTSRRVVF